MIREWTLKMEARSYEFSLHNEVPFTKFWLSQYMSFVCDDLWGSNGLGESFSNKKGQEVVKRHVLLRANKIMRINDDCGDGLRRCIFLVWLNFDGICCLPILHHEGKTIKIAREYDSDSFWYFKFHIWDEVLIFSYAQITLKILTFRILLIIN